MYNPFTKTLRYLRRECPVETGFTVGTTLLGLAIGVPAVITSGGSLLLIPAIAGGAGAFGLLVTKMPTPFDESPHGNSAYINGVKVVGSKRDVRSVYNTQELLNGITRNLTHLHQLPPRTERRVARHINDLKKRLARVRVYDGGGQPVGAFSFTRRVIDGEGREVTQTLAAVPVPMTAREERAKLLPAVLEGPGPLSLPAPAPAPAPAPTPKPDATAEFGTLARKVEQIAGNVNEVEKRVGQLENPSPAVLDKPKLGHG